MDLSGFIGNIFLLVTVLNAINAFNNNNINEDIDNKNDFKTEEFNNTSNGLENRNDNKLNDIFKGVYTDCLMKFSYLCIQNKTLLYLEELNSMSEVSVIGDYVKFGKFFLIVLSIYILIYIKGNPYIPRSSHCA